MNRRTFLKTSSTLAVLPAAGCVSDQDPALLRDIRRHPAAYYANIHNLDFVPGAIRGQLRRVA